MRTAFVALLLSFVAPGVSSAEPPAGFAFDVVTSPGVDAFAQEAMDAARAELARARLLDLAGPEGRLHGRDPEARRKVERARATFTEALHAYDNLELTEAITKLGRVIADLDAGWVAVDDPAVLVDALLRLGAALVLDGRPRDAEAPFARVHALAPDRLPDPEVYPEQVTSRFRQVVARVARAGLGALEVRANPPGALVYVDGRFAGRAPATVEDLAPGTHLVRVRAPGFIDQAASATVRAGRPEGVNVRLAVAEGAAGLPEALDGLAGNSPGAVDRVGELLGLQTVVVLRFSDAAGSDVELEGLRYDLSSDAPPVRRTATVSADPEGVEAVVQLAVALVRNQGGGVAHDPGRGRRGVGGRNGRGPAGPIDVTEESPGLTSRWWFWTGVAVVAVAGAAVIVVLTSGGEEPAQRPPGELVLRF